MKDHLIDLITAMLIISTVFPIQTAAGQGLETSIPIPREVLSLMDEAESQKRTLDTIDSSYTHDLERLTSEKTTLLDSLYQAQRQNHVNEEAVIRAKIDLVDDEIVASMVGRDVAKLSLLRDAEQTTIQLEGVLESIIRRTPKSAQNPELKRALVDIRESQAQCANLQQILENGVNDEVKFWAETRWKEKAAEYKRGRRKIENSLVAGQNKEDEFTNGYRALASRLAIYRISLGDARRAIDRDLLVTRSWINQRIGSLDLDVAKRAFDRLFKSNDILLDNLKRQRQSDSLQTPAGIGGAR